jgi:hypothetical protein
MAFEEGSSRRGTFDFLWQASARLRCVVTRSACGSRILTIGESRLGRVDGITKRESKDLPGEHGATVCHGVQPWNLFLEIHMYLGRATRDTCQ